MKLGRLCAGKATDEPGWRQQMRGTSPVKSRLCLSPTLPKKASNGFTGLFFADENNQARHVAGKVGGR